MDDGLRGFMEHWFAGLVTGLAEVDEDARDAILRACGRACADSYTAQVFQEAWQESRDLDRFLARLAGRFPGATYERTGPHSIRVTYASCGCDLVRLGLVESPFICGCSAHNLQDNLERALGTPVTVDRGRSILEGASNCTFDVQLGEEAARQ
jgi:predicted ArsR family transcriptional regulator